jgi:archaetidylinositol phosphate synthase
MDTISAAFLVRDHRSFLAASEKLLLVWIAERLPQRINSDHLTLLGLCGMLTAGVGYALAGWTNWALGLVVVALAVNWFGDSLDGTLARVRRQERPRYGYYVDHVLDLVGICALLAGLAFSPFMHPTVAVCLLVTYMLVMAESFLGASAHGVFRMSSLGFGPTELRIVLAIGTLALLRDPRVDLAGFGRYRLFDVGGAIAAIGLAATFAIGAARSICALSRAEPLARDRTSQRT